LPSDDGLSDINKKGRSRGRPFLFVPYLGESAFAGMKIALPTGKMKNYRKFLPRF
jgi:hypothetical protein